MKAILVIDMPKCCNECKCNFDHWCSFDSFERYIDDLEQKPDWCPLKPMPNKINHEAHSVIEYVSSHQYICGWNDCLEEIEK